MMVLGELDKVIHDANSEISRLRDKVAVLSTSEEDLKRKNHDLLENWREKGRKLAQVQVFLFTSGDIPACLWKWGWG